MLSGPGLVFVGERDCKVEEAQVDEKLLGPGEVVVDLEVSIISAGTEVANFTGLDPASRIPGSWNEYPTGPGRSGGQDRRGWASGAGARPWVGSG